jgi:hypothetical protein
LPVKLIRSTVFSDSVFAILRDILAVESQTLPEAAFPCSLAVSTCICGLTEAKQFRVAYFSEPGANGFHVERGCLDAEH